MANVLRRRVQTTPTQVGSAGATLLTFSDKLVEGGAIVRKFTICNNASAARVVRVRLVPSGGTAGDQHNLYNQSIAATTTVQVSGPWWENSAATLQALTDNAATDVTVTPTAFEEVQQG